MVFWGDYTTTLSSDFDEWITYYYLEPKPDEVGSALKELGDRGDFEADSVQAPFSGFFFQVFQNNPERIDEWIGPYIGVPKRHILYSALWMANSKESLAALEQLAQGTSQEEAENLRALVSVSPPTIETMDVNSPAVLDYFWGCYMASGSEIAVERIIDQVKLSNASEDLGTKMIGGAASWSLAANARQHPKVLEMLKANLDDRDEETRAILEEIIAGAEEKPE